MVSSTHAIRNAQAVLRDVKALEDLIASQEDTIRSLVGQRAHLQRIVDGTNALPGQPAAADPEVELGRVKAVLKEVTEEGERRREFVRLKLARVNDLPASQVMSVSGVAELLEEILEQ